MSPGTKTAAALGAVALIGVAAVYALSTAKGGGAGKFLLQTSVGPGGTITPSSVSGIFEPAGQVVNVVITANPGYTIGQVLQNGSPINSSTTDTVETYQITMNMNHEIDATFYQGGQPPVGAPTQIQALDLQTIVWGYYGCKLTMSSPVPLIQNIGINTCDQNWHYGNYVWNQNIRFKVIDANGKGVSGIKVALYPSLVPDNSKYIGYLVLGNQMATQQNPLMLISGSDGIVKVNLAYFCDTSSINQPNKLPYDAGLYLNGRAPYNGETDILGTIVWSKGGHGVTGQGPAAMGNMQ